MTRYGYTLFSELNPPTSLVDQAVDAEDAGFDFAVISDHFHPWLSTHTDSPFAWSVLGAVAHATTDLDLTTLVTCPFLRYHPAVIAQAAATVQLLSDGRFTLGVGAGERLNEHVVGRGWPSVDVRHEMLRESIEAIRALWDGGFTTYRGEHVTVEDAKLFSLPDEEPEIAVAASGPESLGIAVEHGDAMVAIEPDAALVEEFRDRHGGDGWVIGQVPMAWDPDEDAAREMAMRFAFGMPGWKVMAELPNTVNFDAAVGTVREDDVTAQVGVGPDPANHLERINAFVDAGFDEICVVQVGDDRGDGFFDFWAEEIAPELA